MGAIISDNVKLSDVLKYVGYNCPEDLMDTTINELIAGGGDTPECKLYAWKGVDSRDSSTRYFYFNTDVAPATAEEAGTELKYINYDSLTGAMEAELYFAGGDTYTRVSDTSFTDSWEESGETATITFTRDSTKDVTVW